jgi:hypothetical protein
MAYGACDECGCAHSECECEDRRKAAEENKRNERLAKEWEAQKAAIIEGPLIPRLVTAWSKVPQLRLGQFIVNAMNGVEPFYISDDDLVRTLEEYAERHGK